MRGLSIRLAGMLAAFALFGQGLVLAAQPGAPKGAYYGALPTEYPAWFKESFLNLRDDVAEAAAAGKRVMMVFHQDNCPYCNVLVERNFSQKDIEEYTRKHFDAIGINMWGDREVVDVDGKRYTEKSFAAAQKVQFTPTILFFDENARVILRLNGYLPPQRFKLALEYVAQRKEKEMSYRDYVAAQQPPAAQGAMHAEDFFRKPPYDLRRQGQRAKPLAVFFEQPDCPACDTLHKDVLVDPETRAIIGKFDNVQLDMWSNTPLTTPDGKRMTAREWAKALNVQYAPTIVLFDTRGKEIIRSEAFFKVFHTQGIFDYVLSGAYRTEPSLQRYLSARAEHIREQGKDVDIWRLANEPVGSTKK